MTTAEFAVIGGSGLYALEEGFIKLEEVDIDTPFGKPSDRIVIGEIAGKRVAFLPRHGVGHRISPTELPVRANIWALKSLGVRKVLSVSAVGSLREEIAPLHLVVPDQIIDRTKSRVNSFFEDGIVVHAAFADPFCAELSAIVAACAEETGATVHRGGTLIVMEGPLFSTRAESELYRSWGAHIIGMTALPEAKLAREAELCYATLACATDYDVWHPHHDDVTIDMVIQNLLRNTATAQAIIKSVVARIDMKRDCKCERALEFAIITDRRYITPEHRRKYGLLIDKYLDKST
ncbi:MAG: S-methyl-5'-thioadenosine phosphorylase [Chloroflexota bacterium]|nr:S-methyl-5'-thioadenosine phosphorylase [Dehalococcoidia bacterium]MDW8252583.1 S-methyl-5'-thioadenosine phosphorylase [Chloroflexota bacterium]